MAAADSWAISDPRADAAALIPRILAERAVFPQFQPIMDLGRQTLVGVEALARGPAGSPVQFPDVLFAAATRAGLLPLLDQLCCARALEVATEAGDTVPPLVFVNAEPSVLNHEMTPDLIAALTAERSFRMVLEFTERALPAHPSSLLAIAAGSHLLGNALALDDVGADPLSLAFLPIIEPEVVKLDMTLLRDPHAPGTVATVVAVNGYAERTGAMIIAEGIETAEDLARARSFGARWGQGWYFARPGPLGAFAGLPVDPYARLRQPRPGLHLPPGTPYSLASGRRLGTRGDGHAVTGLFDHLLAAADIGGPHTVVLGAYTDVATGQAWTDRLGRIPDPAALVGLLGPAVSGVDPRPVRHAALPTDDGLGGESVLAVVGPRTTMALCVRPGGDDVFDFVLTHDPDVVHGVARMLLRRLDTAADRRTPAELRRWQASVVGDR